jgi:hypothetical protein
MRQTLLERLAAYAWEHGFPSRINWDNGDVSVLIPYGRNAQWPIGGADWHHASNFYQLRSILGY